MLRPLALVLLALPTAAQLPRDLSDSARISLLTLSPGLPVHTLFGHGALRVVDPELGLDAAFNYGTFDFGPGFVPTFMRGELDYYLSVSDTRYTLEEARAMDRVAVEQVFDLSATEREALYDALVENARPENRTYRYDFLFDNCSTRLVGVMRRALGDGLVVPPPPPPRTTFRGMLHEHLGARPWLRFGIDLLLGATVDRATTGEEEWFLPERFMRSIDDATLDGEPLVARTDVVVGDEWELPPRGLDQAEVAGWLLFALGAALGLRPGRARLARTFDLVLFALAGAAGVLVAGMWAFTLHHVTAENWNLLWLPPTHLVAALVLVTSRRPRALRIYLGLSAAAALAVVFAPGVPQELPDAATPLAALLALRALIAAFRDPAATSEPAA